MAVSFLASQLSDTKSERMVVDFGVSAVGISCSMIAVFVGSMLLGREFERRTIFVALSRPISRFQFLVGKFAGICGVLALNWALLGVAFVLILWVVSPQGMGYFFNATTGLALFFALLQAVVVASLALLFSAFSTTSLSVIMTLGLYLVGNNLTQLRWVARKLDPGPAQAFLKSVVFLLPGFENFHLGNRVTYGLPVEPMLALQTTLYGCAWAAFFVVLGGIMIQRRDQ
jgi:ABC-type Na+ efflux pump permease subunit